MRSPLKLLAAFAAASLLLVSTAEAQFGIPGIPRVGVPRIPGIGGGRVGTAVGILNRLGVVNIPSGYSSLGSYYAPGVSSIYLGSGYGPYGFSPYGFGPYGYSPFGYGGSGFRIGFGFGNGWYSPYSSYGRLGYYGLSSYNPYSFSRTGLRLALDNPAYWGPYLARNGTNAGGSSYSLVTNTSSSSNASVQPASWSRWVEPLESAQPVPLLAVGTGTPYQGPIRPVAQPAYANPFTPYSTRPSAAERTIWWPYFQYDPQIAYYGSGVDDATYQVAYVDELFGPAVAPFRPGARSEPQPVSEEDRESAQRFTRQGEQEFRSASYDRATRSFRHAILDDPRNGVVMLMLAQGLLATGSYDEAAGATQQAMLLLPEEQWGVVVANYKDLYGRASDFNDQLKALQKASDEQAENPALHFLLAYQYGYLGYPDFAIKRLAKVANMAPDDRLSTRLKQIMEAKLKDTSVLPPE